MNAQFLDLHAAAERLVHGAIVGIFPEGKSHDLPHVEPVKSGAARIAFDAVKSGARDLRIVPIGINYERKEAFRSAVWVRVSLFRVRQLLRECVERKTAPADPETSPA